MYSSFLDILGFKNMINTKAFEEIREIFSNVIPQSDFAWHWDVQHMMKI